MFKIKKLITLALTLSLIMGNFSFSFANLNNTNISNEEKVKIEQELVNLQLNFLNNSKKYFDLFSNNFQKLSNYEENGSSKIELFIDQDSIGKVSTNINLNNLNIKSSFLNSSISTDIDFQTKVDSIYVGTGQKFNLKTFVSLINKDTNMYALVKNLDIETDNKEVSKIFEDIKNKFKDNKYIKFPQKDENKIILDFINKIDINSFFSESQKTLQKSFFNVESKVGDKYILIPSKHFCSTYLSISNKLDSIFVSRNIDYVSEINCNDFIYKNLLDSFKKDLEIYFIKGDKKNTFGFTSKEKDYQGINRAVIDLSLKYNQENITNIDFSIIPEQTKFKDENFTLSYEINNFLKSKFYANKGKMKMNLDSILDEKNNFISIESSINLDNNLFGELNLKDKKVKGLFTFKDKKTEYINKCKNKDINKCYDKNGNYLGYVPKTSLKSIYGVKINGNLDDDNYYTNLNTKFIGIDYKSKKEFISGNFEYKDNNFSTKVNYEDSTSNFKFSGKGKLENNFIYSENKFSIKLPEKVNNDFYGEMNFTFDTKDNNNNSNILFKLNSGIENSFKNENKNILKLQINNLMQKIYKNNIQIEDPKDFIEFKNEVLNNIQY